MRTSFSLAVAVTALFAVGCGRYESEPAYPPGYVVEAPRPLTSEELAQQQQQQQQRAEANAEGREILIGGDSEGSEYSDADPSALTEFKPALDSHGAWVEDATYGTVWVPSKEEVGTDFQPYVSAGHWTYSDDTDYVWVSDYSWGWAPFHYGRWVYLPGYGWSWIPGRRYSGAWVTWRVGPAGYGYVGWAPAPPSWYWYNGAAYGWHFGWYHHHDHYVYCPREYVYHGVVGGHVVRGPAAQEHYGRTHDYVPAAPPSRVVASPTVGGPERTLATPTVGASAGRVVGNARGPRPDEMGIKGETVVAPPSSHPSLDRARSLATVQPGAARPSTFDRGPATASFVPNGGTPVTSQPVRSANANAMMTSRPSHVEPYTPPSSSGSPAYDAPARSHSPASAFRSEARPVPSTGSSTPAFRSSPPPSVSAVRGASSFRASPSVSPAPTFRAPSRSAEVMRSSPAPTFRASPSVASSPSHSAAAIRSSPSVHATPSNRGSTVTRSNKR